MADKSKIVSCLFLCGISIMMMPFFGSCGKSGTISPSNSDIQMQIVNLSPDALPVNLWVGYVQQNKSPYIYPTASGYFSLTNIDTPVQIRSYYASISTTNLVSINTPLKANLKYTLFLTGLRADSSITSIFTVDTAAVPTVGRGKVRFVNASPGSSGFDITANGTMAFTNQTYKNVSPFIQLPPGTYDFKIMPTGTSTAISDLSAVSIQDGKIYTLYCYGISGGADSVAFSSSILSNK